MRRTLARDPAQRYQHTYELQEALAQILFERGLKVTSRDIAKLVRRCMTKRRHGEPIRDRTRGVINTLIQEEILKFTSLETSDFEAAAGSQPLSPGDLGPGGGPLDPRDFIDPRNWSNEFAAVDPEGRVSLEEVPEVVSLERVLEGSGTDMTDITSAKPAKRRPRRALQLLVGLLAFLALGATTILVLHALGIISISAG